MQKERLDAALEKITDREWGLFKAFIEKDAPMHCEYITPEEAAFLKVIGRLIPEKFVPFVVLQWAGEQGRLLFVDALKDGGKIDSKNV